MDDELLTLARLARLLERACGELEPPLTLAQYRLLTMMGSGADRASHLAGQLALAKPTVTATGRRVLADAEAVMRARLDDVLARIDDPTAVPGALTALAAGLDERRS